MPARQHAHLDAVLNVGQAGPEQDLDSKQVGGEQTGQPGGVEARVGGRPG
jgi:hypothetical protein